MTRYQIDLVQKSWKQVVPIRDIAAELFYGDMKEQGRKRLAMISVAVAAAGAAAEP